MQRRVREAQNSIVLPYEELEQKRREKQKGGPGDSLVQRSVEELRVSFLSLNSDMRALQDQFADLENLTSHKLEKKVDDANIERIFNKVHRMLGQQLTRIEALEEREEAVRRAEEEARRRMPKDPNAPSVRVSRKKVQGPVASMEQLVREQPLTKPLLPDRAGGTLSDPSRRLVSSLIARKS
jgi:hypothetical protein